MASSWTAPRGRSRRGSWWSPNRRNSLFRCLSYSSAPTPRVIRCVGNMFRIILVLKYTESNSYALGSSDVGGHEVYVCLFRGCKTRIYYSHAVRASSWPRKVVHKAYLCIYVCARRTIILHILGRFGLRNSSTINNICLTSIYSFSQQRTGEGQAGDVRRTGRFRMPLLQVLCQDRPLHNFHGQPQVHHGEEPPVLDAQGDCTAVQHRLTSFLDWLLRETPTDVRRGTKTRLRPVDVVQSVK